MTTDDDIAAAPCNRCGLAYLEGRVCSGSGYSLLCNDPALVASDIAAARKLEGNNPLQVPEPRAFKAGDWVWCTYECVDLDGSPSTVRRGKMYRVDKRKSGDYFNGQKRFVAVECMSLVGYIGWYRCDNFHPATPAEIAAAEAKPGDDWSVCFDDERFQPRPAAPVPPESAAIAELREKVAELQRDYERDVIELRDRTTRLERTTRACVDELADRASDCELLAKRADQADALKLDAMVEELRGQIADLEDTLTGDRLTWRLKLEDLETRLNADRDAFRADRDEANDKARQMRDARDALSEQLRTLTAAELRNTAARIVARVDATPVAAPEPVAGERLLRQEGKDFAFNEHGDRATCWLLAPRDGESIALGMASGNRPLLTRALCAELAPLLDGFARTGELRALPNDNTRKVENERMAHELIAANEKLATMTARAEAAEAESYREHMDVEALRAERDKLAAELEQTNARNGSLLNQLGNAQNKYAALVDACEGAREITCTHGLHSREFDPAWMTVVVALDALGLPAKGEANASESPKGSELPAVSEPDLCERVAIAAYIGGTLVRPSLTALDAAARVVALVREHDAANARKAETKPATLGKLPTVSELGRCTYCGARSCASDGNGCSRYASDLRDGKVKRGFEVKPATDALTAEQVVEQIAEMARVTNPFRWREGNAEVQTLIERYARRHNEASALEMAADAVDVVAAENQGCDQDEYLSTTKIKEAAVKLRQRASAAREDGGKP